MLGKLFNFSGPHCLILLWGSVPVVPFVSTADVPTPSTLLHLASITPSLALGLTFSTPSSPRQPFLTSQHCSGCPFSMILNDLVAQAFPVIAVQPYVIVSCLLDSFLKAGPLTYIPSAGHNAWHEEDAGKRKGKNNNFDLKGNRDEHEAFS